MAEFACNVTVKSYAPNTGGFGAVAVVEYAQGGGIDIAPQGEITVELTEDSAGMFSPGATLKLTIEAL